MSPQTEKLSVDYMHVKDLLLYNDIVVLHSSTELRSIMLKYRLSDSISYVFYLTFLKP